MRRTYSVVLPFLPSGVFKAVMISRLEMVDRIINEQLPLIDPFGEVDSGLPTEGTPCRSPSGKA